MQSDENSLLSFLYACPVGLIEFDRAGRIGMLNPHAMKLLMPLAGPMGPEDMFAFLERHAPDLRNLVEGFAEDHGTIREGHRIHVDLGDIGRKGGPQVLCASIIRLGPDRYMATLSDISAQVAQEHRLAQADAWFSALIDGINGYALLAVSGNGTILSANRHFAEQTGHPIERVVGCPVREFLQGHDCGGHPAGNLADEFHAATRDGWVLREGWESRADGGRYWCQRLIVARDDPGLPDDPERPAYSMVLRDVPPRDGSAADLVAMLTRDHLTGAANRMHFQKVLRRERLRWMRSKCPASLTMLDLDHFKAINDTYGHPVGDEVLREVAALGLSRIPHGGVFCRLGGEEFAVLLPEADLAAAHALAEDLRAEISRLSIGASGIRVTASFGCAAFAEVDGSTEALIALADERLYAAKRAGRDRVLAATA